MFLHALSQWHVMYSGRFFLARRALIGLNIEGLIQDAQDNVHDANGRYEYWYQYICRSHAELTTGTCTCYEPVHQRILLSSYKVVDRQGRRLRCRFHKAWGWASKCESPFQHRVKDHLAALPPSNRCWSKIIRRSSASILASTGTSMELAS